MQEVAGRLMNGRYTPAVALSPEIAAAVQCVRDESWQLIAERQALLDAGVVQDVPLVIDALSTAESVVIARDDTQDNRHYGERYDCLVTDCVRLIQEWNRKLKPEAFSELRHHYSQAEEEFYSHGMAIGQMTLNALRPIAESPEEEARRVNERVEHRLPIIIQKAGGFALHGVGIRTISECTDKAIQDYEDDKEHMRPHRGYDGYVPEVKKLMIRDIRIDPETGDRLQTQIGLLGEYSITHQVIQEALRRKGVDTSGMGKTELHGLQLLVDDDLKDFVKLLDEVATEDWCVPIFLGERVGKDHSRDYDAFWEEAAHREEDLRDLAEVTATFLIDLVDDNFDRRKAPGHVEAFVKKLLLDRAKKDITVAQYAFGEKTAASILEVVALEKRGLYQEAFAVMAEAEKAAPGGGYCSGGSCGLESVDLNSEEGKKLAENTKAESGDTIVRDKERACKCGAKEIVYAYNKNKVNKYCGNCKAFESKATKNGK
jgi:hypothetical protein